VQRHSAHVEEVNAEYKGEQCAGSRDYQLFVVEDLQSAKATETLTGAFVCSGAI
jgi:hypothetical protein